MTDSTAVTENPTLVGNNWFERIALVALLTALADWLRVVPQIASFQANVIMSIGKRRGGLSLTKVVELCHGVDE